jgi:hypothetical protein
MKKALLGLSNNIKDNFSKILVWSKSFKKYSEGEVILLCANATQDEISMCESIGITTVPVVINNTWFINHKRIERTFEFLNESEIDLFLITDVFDVVFQGDPFEKWDLNYDIFVSGEGVLVGDEPWNTDNISKIFPSEIQKCRPNEVICSGVIGGKRTSLIPLYKRIFELCEKGSDNHNIKDQAALIVMIANNEIPNIKIFNLDEAWAMHCAVAGPTPFFDGWGFRGKLKYGIPYMEGNVVYTKQGIKYDIVHQFNRVPSWNDVLIKDYV